MKTLKYLGFILIGLFVFMACQKETSLETGFSGGNAVGSLSSNSGQCASISINGEYVRDSVLKDSNYVIVKVNFASPGLYKIITETENGFSFYDSGYMINTGLQSIKLKAVGKPLLTQNTSFLLTFDTSFCSFTIPVVDTPNKKATYISAGCGTLSPTDTFQVGVPINTLNPTLTIKLDVSKKGSYSIATPTRNGITFRGTGYLNVGSNQTITLSGTGTPITAGNDTIYTIINGDTTCFAKIFIKPVTTAPVEDSSWQFNQGTGFYYGGIDSAKFDSITVITLSGPTKVPGMGIWGTSYETGDSAFFIGVPLTAGTVAPGTYNSNSLSNPAAFNFYLTPTVTSIIYTASYADLALGVNLVVTITSYNATTRIVTGTFTGTARNATLSSVPITNGKFTATVQ